MITGSYKNWKLAAFLVIVIHLMLVILHAAAHQILKVDPTTLQLSLILIVIMAAPLVAGLLLWKWDVPGSILLTLSMAGSFLFGAYNHFVGHSIDQVAEVANLRPAIWSNIFTWTAIGLAISETAGTAAGIFLLASRRSESAGAASIGIGGQAS